MPSMPQLQMPQVPQAYQQQQGGNFFDSLKNYLLGTSGGYQQVPTLPRYQSQGLDQIFGQGLGAINNPYEGFDPLQRQTENDFFQNYVPGLAERFTAAGGGGQRSSAFQGALGNAGSGLAALLNAQRSQYGMQNKQYGLNATQLGLTPQFSNEYQPGQEGLLEQLLPLLAQGGLMYATGGLSGAPAIANLISQGVGKAGQFFNNKQGNSQGSNSQASPFNSQASPFRALQGNLTTNAQLQKTGPNAIQGYGPTQLQGPLQNRTISPYYFGSPSFYPRML